MNELDALAAQIRNCTDCALSRTRLNAVPGEGSESPEIMFIGEGPGFHEDRQGRPFVGPAGKYLNQLLASISMRREQVYIANVVKCRPPNNRDPLPGEIQACRKYLDRQIAILKPTAIVTLGRFSLTQFFPGEIISRAHGKPHFWNNTMVFPMYHPAAALHQGNMRTYIEEDFRSLPRAILETNLVLPSKQEHQGEQLSLF